MAKGKTASVAQRCGSILDAGTSDGELMERFNASRDESAQTAFEALVRRHGPMVLRICTQILGDRHGAEDAFQATFLVLARKSGSIRRPELLGNWLYGVALRTAGEARMRDGRRRKHETSLTLDGHQEPAVDAGRTEATIIHREEFEALHEEVSRLPDRYRIPVVLCELEGLTYQEVASRMNCPVSTIGVRLIRARERLRLRMIRRGIVPVAVLTNTLFGAEGATMAMPAVLVESTVRAAAAFAASDTAAVGFVSAVVLSMTGAILKTMALARLKAGTSLVLLVGLTSGLVGIVAHRPASPMVWLMSNTPRPVRALLSPTNASVEFGSHANQAAPRNAPLASASAIPVTVPEPDRPFVASIDEVSPQEGQKPSVLPAMATVHRLVREERTRGEALFFKEWVPNDVASPRGDGLGPVYNETSCVACHLLGAPGGAGPETKNVVILTVIPAGSRIVPKGLEKVHPGFRATRSTVLHRYGTDSRYSSWRRNFFESRAENTKNDPEEAVEETVEARIRRIAEQTTPKHRSLEHPSLVNPAPGIALRVSERNTPALFGAGRIDSIPSSVLVQEAKWQPADIRGRVSRDSGGRVGRFGWKAQVASLHEFVRVACAGELGLEVPGHSQSISPLAPLDKPKGLDLSQPECDALVAYIRSLPTPVVIDPFGPKGSQEMAEGRRLFAEVGCAACHTPSLGEVRGIYSDLLLHEMGSSLSDTGEYYSFDDPSSTTGPSSGEWRTPPLWGFRDSAPYLHDGRAETLEEAVALHGGQGAKAAHKFFSITPEERSCIEVFLKSLVAPSSVAAPGMLLAAEFESRVEPDEMRQAEAEVRRQREEAEVRDLEQQSEARRRQIAAAGVKLAPGRFLMAGKLENAGRINGAIEFYRMIVKEAPGTEEARSADARITTLLSTKKSP